MSMFKKTIIAMVIIMSTILPNKLLRGVPNVAEAENSVARFVGTNTIGGSNEVYIDSNGNLSVGTSLISGEKVTVAGNIISTGISWTLRNQIVNNEWRTICYGNGLFVALSYTGTGNRVMTSPDGITWTSRTSAADNWWRSICFGNGLFVAVSDGATGSGNRIMTSPDGITWTSRVNPEDNDWTGVAYGNNIFVAVSSNGTNRVMTSYDGIIWTARAASTNNEWNCLTYGNGLFVAMAKSGTQNRIMTSPDGINWTTRTFVNDIYAWESVCYGNGLFVGVNRSGPNERVATSPNGINWTFRATPSNANAYWRSVIYGNGLFVAVASLSTGTNDRIMTSTDGITWKVRYCPQDNYWNAITFGNGTFVAVSYGGTNRVMTSGKMVKYELPTKNKYNGGMIVTGITTLGDGGITNYTSIASDGTITLFGAAQKWSCVDLEPENIGLPSANPPLRDEYQGSSFDRYDRSTEEQVYFTWHIPSDFAEGSQSVRGHFGGIVENPPSGSGDENVVMGFEYKKFSPGDVFDFSSGTSTGTVNILIEDGESPYEWKTSEVGYCNTTGWKAEDIIKFRFFRDATNVNDTYDNEAVAANNDMWIGVYHLEYLKDKIGSN